MALFLLIIVPAAFGLNPVIARALSEEVAPGTLSLIRWSLAALIIGSMAVARRDRESWRLPHRYLPRLILLGALGMGFCSYAAYASVSFTTATTLGIIYACTPAQVALVEIIGGRQRPTLMLSTGLIVCLAGVATVLSRGDLSALATFRIGNGELWALAGAMVWGFYSIGMNRVPSSLTPLAQFTVMAIAGALFCVPAAVRELIYIGPPQFQATAVFWVTALVLIASCFSFLGYNRSMAVNGVVLTSASISLSPVYIAGLAVMLIGEQIEWFHVLSLLLVVAGLMLINLDRVQNVATTRTVGQGSTIT